MATQKKNNKTGKGVDTVVFFFKEKLEIDPDRPVLDTEVVTNKDIGRVFNEMRLITGELRDNVMNSTSGSV